VSEKSTSFNLQSLKHAAAFANNVIAFVYLLQILTLGITLVVSFENSFVEV